MKKILIICNGPSTKNLDWNFLKKNRDKIDTFCLNSCYRKFKELDFYPTYFGCFDYVVGKNHKKEYQKLLLGKNNIKNFFFLNNLKLKDPDNRLNTISIKENKKEKISNTYNNFNNWLNSGANSVHVSIMMGYTEIYLIGVDGYKKDIINEASKLNVGAQLIVKETPKNNPNYFFDDYQRKNDIYNRVQQDKFQKPGWELVGKITKKNNIKVFNMSNREYIKCFDFIDLKKFYSNI